MEALAPAIRLFDGQWVEPLTADTAIVPTIIVFSAALVAFGLCLWAALVFGKRILASDARMTRTEEKPRRVLLMGLSKISPDVEKGLLSSVEPEHLPDIARPVAAFFAIPEACRPPDSLWQQNIRSMYRHLPTLETVIILPSEESSRQFQSFKAYAERLFSKAKPGLKIDFVRDRLGEEGFFSIPQDEGISRSYENYRYVLQGLLRGLEQAGYPGRTEAKDICIDSTAGPKTFSIGAAIVTLNTEIVFSYVTTASQDKLRGGEVRFYDATVEFAGFPG
jgi:hypothetical protein